MRSRPGFPTRRASALICMAALIANVIKASSPWAAHKGRTYGRTAPVWGQQRKNVSLTAGSFHIWESRESASRRVGITDLFRLLLLQPVTGSIYQMGAKHPRAGRTLHGLESARRLENAPITFSADE
jgi:hypothetical protein